MASDDSPILLQRHCEVFYRLRADHLTDEVKNADLEEITKVARGFLPRGRVWIDLVMAYVGEAANEQAKNQTGRKSVRLASWEVFASDLIFCPAGQRKLDPRWYALAEAAIEGAPA